MSNSNKHKDSFDKRAANLRANLLRRKAQSKKLKKTSTAADALDETSIETSQETSE